MKKILIVTFLISGMTLLGFWCAKKACVMMCPALLESAPAGYAALKLDPQQTQTFQKLESDFQRDADALCMELCKERAQLLEMLGDEQILPSAIDVKIARIGQLQTNLEKAAATRILDGARVLTPQQRKAYLAELSKKLGSCVTKKN